jgi:hypothetical protein
MTTIKATSILAATILGCVVLCGCDAGSQPKGMSNDDAKSAIDKMTPENKIKAIASSPLPAAEKERRYAEIEKETGVKASTVLAGMPKGTGTGN